MKLMMIAAVTHQIPHLLSGAWDKIGILSLMSIFGVNVADKSGAIQLSSELASEWGVFDWLGLVGGLGSVAFLVKCLLEIRLTYLRIRAESKTSDE